MAILFFQDHENREISKVTHVCTHVGECVAGIHVQFFSALQVRLKHTEQTKIYLTPVSILVRLPTNNNKKVLVRH